MAHSANESHQAFFSRHGLRPTAPETLNDALVQAIEALQVSVFAPATSELTDAEYEALTGAGVTLASADKGPDPLMRTATEFAAILSQSLTTTEAAHQLSLHPTRIRQLLAERSLYAFQINGRWRIPSFQFDDDQLVPNIAAVNAAIDPELDPVSVLRWYTQPDTELESPDGQALSPLQWLKTGLGAEKLIPIARSL